MTGHGRMPLLLVVGAILATSNAPGVVVGGAAWHQVTAGESLTSIAARAGLDLSTLAADNGLRSVHRLAVDSWLLVDNSHIVPQPFLDGIVVNVPQRMLHLAVEGRHVLSVPVAVGRPDWPTPIGNFAVAVKETDPTWDVPVSIQAEMAREGKRVVTRVPPGAENPLGRHWIGLTAPGVGIHGTDAPASIYRFATHGCIRAHPDDIARVFALADVGMPARMIYEPVLIAEAETGEVWLEVHRDPYRRAGNALQTARDLLQNAGLGDLASSPLLEDIVQARHGRAERLR